MHGKRLTTYRRLGFHTGAIPLPISTVPEPTQPQADVKATPPAPHSPLMAAHVRAWAYRAGLTVAVKGRLRPEVWAAYHEAHPNQRP